MSFSWKWKGGTHLPATVQENEKLPPDREFTGAKHFYAPDLKRGVVVQAVILPAETVAALAPGITSTVKIEDGIPAEHSGFHISNTFCFIKDFFIKSFSVYKTYATAYTLK